MMQRTGLEERDREQAVRRVSAGMCKYKHHGAQTINVFAMILCLQAQSINIQYNTISPGAQHLLNDKWCTLFHQLAL